MILWWAALIALLAVSTPGQAEELLPPVDEEISDMDVLEAINPEYPGLDAFARAVQAGDTQRGTELLAEHFATRQTPCVPEARHPAIHPSDSTMMLKASAPRSRPPTRSGSGISTPSATMTPTS